MAGCGLPGFANFVGEVTVLFGAWRVYPPVTVLAVWGALIVGAVYLLRAIRAVLHGPLSERWAGVADASFQQRLPYALLLTSLLLFGFFPRLLTDKIRLDANRIVNMTAMKDTQPTDVAVWEKK
jgi:NADH-quinone oxidoreductase subunit M